MGTVEGKLIRVLVVDHNPFVREGISLSINLESDLDLVEVVECGAEGVRAFKEHRPDVTLMDLDLPRSAALDAIRAIRAIDSEACILGLLTHERDEVCQEAIDFGIQRCITKDTLKTELIPAIRECWRRNS
jgi:two-component system NarL family response regulator